MKDQLLSLWGSLCGLTVVFLLLLVILVLCGLIFINLINIVLGCFTLDFSCLGLSSIFWTWVAISFPILGKFSNIISSIFSCPFFSSSSSGTPMIQMLGHLILSQIFLRLSSFLLIIFFFFPLCFIFSTILSSTSRILSSASVVLLLITSRVFLSKLLHC